MRSWGERWRDRECTGCSPGRDSVRLVLCLEVFLSLLQAWILGEASAGEGSAEHSSVLQVCPFRVTISSDWSVTGSLVTAVGSGIPHLVSLLFWAWSWNIPEAQMLSPGRRGQARKGHPGGELLVFLVFPLPGWPSIPGVNCSATVFNYESQFPYSTPKRVFLASHYAVSGLQLWVHEREFILILLFINYCTSFHTNNCKPTPAPPCIVRKKQLAVISRQ